VTNGDVEECVLALAEYKAASIAYAHSYDAMDRYKKADSALRGLLWSHGPGLIELAHFASKSQP
jgi:hypothetical protein